jgi:hypothetical protein
MKKILLFLLILISLKSFSQYPALQTLGSDSTLVSSKGAFKSRLINFIFVDTLTANLQHIKQYPGAQIFTSSDNKVRVRNSTATAWLELGSSLSTVTIIDSNHFQVCVIGGVCTIYTTTVNAQLVSILDSVTLNICDTLGNCQPFTVPQTTFIQTLWDSVPIYTLVNSKLNIIDTIAKWLPLQNVVDTAIYIDQDTTKIFRFVYSSGAVVDDTLKGMITINNLNTYLTQITNILNSADSIRDTTIVTSTILNGDTLLTGKNSTTSFHVDSLFFYMDTVSLTKSGYMTPYDFSLLGTGGGGGGGTTADSTLIASGGQTAFTFSGVPASYNDYIIFVWGVGCEPVTSYSTSGDVVTFVSGLSAGDRVRFKRIK